MNRAEHLQWCKQRALEYLDRGDLHGAFSSMASDLGKHPETEGARELNAKLGLPMLLAGLLENPHEMRKWIVGFR